MKYSIILLLNDTHTMMFLSEIVRESLRNSLAERSLFIQLIPINGVIKDLYYVCPRDLGTVFILPTKSR